MDDQQPNEYFVLIYSDRPNKYSSPSDKGLWCAIDSSSGGYPYASEQFTNAKIWTSKKRAIEYKEMFPFLDVYQLSIDLKPL